MICKLLFCFIIFNYINRGNNIGEEGAIGLGTAIQELKQLSQITIEIGGQYFIIFRNLIKFL